MAEAIVASLIKECIRSIRSQMKTEGRSIQHIYRRNGQTETESVNIDDANAYVVTPRRKLQTDELTTVNLYRENAPSVVSITSIAVRQDPFTLDVLEVPQGSGTGFIWDEKGHIVTNYHVIQGASNLRVELDDQSVYEAKVIGYDQDTDVAILGIDAPKKLRPVPVGSSRDLLVGQKVYAIGNPFGLNRALTTGVISGLGREINSAATGRPILDVIQIDAAINPGNSGGPLFDSSGFLIGINTAIYTTSGASAGVGFSIPVDTVSSIVNELVTYGKITRSILGIRFAVDQSVEQLGVTAVLVLDAAPDGPAERQTLGHEFDVWMDSLGTKTEPTLLSSNRRSFIRPI